MTSERISDAAHTISADTSAPLASVQVEYPTCSPFNSTNTLLLLVEVSYFALYDVPTRTRLRPLLVVDASSEPRWSRYDPNVFYFHKGNTLWRYEVDAGAAFSVHAFNEYTHISARGESEISEGSDSLVLAGNDRELFIYHIHTHVKSLVHIIDGGWDSACLTPHGNVLLSQSTIDLYDRDLYFVRKLTRANGHKHVARETNGREVLIWTNANDPTPIPDAQNAIVKVDIETGMQAPLLQLPWSFAVHITAPMGPLGWCIVSTYDNSTEGEIYRQWFDGRTEHLIHHGSDSSTYEGQPHASVSRDGRYLVYNSNVGGRVDVYLVDLEPPVGPPPTPVNDGLSTWPLVLKLRRVGKRVKDWIDRELFT